MCHLKKSHIYNDFSAFLSQICHTGMRTWNIVHKSSGLLLFILSVHCRYNEKNSWNNLLNLSLCVPIEERESFRFGRTISLVKYYRIKIFR